MKLSFEAEIKLFLLDTVVIFANILGLQNTAYTWVYPEIFAVNIVMFIFSTNKKEGKYPKCYNQILSEIIQVDVFLKAAIEN